MAEVDFGDSELFEQLDDSAPPVPTHVRFTDDEEDQEDDDYLQRLTEENILVSAALTVLTLPHNSLRRKQNLLTRPSGIAIKDDDYDGPVLQILYSNNMISKQCRQEIEDCICSLILKHQNPSNEKKKSTFHIKPQVYTPNVVGSVLYFTTFSLDKLGQPLVNENPQLTDGWDVPTYHQVFNQVIGTDGQEIEMKDKRPKSMCFNCGLSGHQLRDCPKPKDMAAINERRKEFNQNSNQGMQSNQRYHADEVEERFAKYKPGVMSEELLTALGIDGDTLPPLIYRMRQLGYPPGWLKEAEMENSGITMYDGNVSNDGSVTDNTNSQNISYDVSKLVDFPGFNVPAPNRIKDVSPTIIFSDVVLECITSYVNPGTPYYTGPGDFQFQPPLPPGSPCFSSPPPLPHGTPPATPTPPPLPKGTPPPTPTNGSPALRGRNWVAVDETVEEPEDDLSLEELEEQQRLIWAALENADTATNSDCDTPVMGTPVPSSPSVSTPVHVDTETENVEEAMDTTKPAETCHSSENPKEPGIQEISSQASASVKVEDDSPQSPEPVKAQEDSPQSPGPVKAQVDNNPQSPVPDFSNGGAGDCASPKHFEKVTAVPHRSNFAAGIVPFEDTPEFTEVAEATGTYLKIRDLLKSSPRNLAKKK
uniref:Zinc finger CCHC domain-containing protein 8 n=1 Tax=Dicentrarchus labrax TaxID=13489 RepID=A0A8C4EHR3_DICLA